MHRPCCPFSRSSRPSCRAKNSSPGFGPVAGTARVTYDCPNFELTHQGANKIINYPVSQSFETVATESLEDPMLGPSEHKLLEEEVDGGLTGLVIVISAGIVWMQVSFVEDTLDLLFQLLSALFVAESVLSNDLLELLTSRGELTSNLESGGQKMVVVYQFDEWLDL